MVQKEESYLAMSQNDACLTISEVGYLVIFFWPNRGFNKEQFHKVRPLGLDIG
jgi:hypothetical protein